MHRNFSAGDDVCEENPGSVRAALDQLVAGLADAFATLAAMKLAG